MCGGQSAKVWRYKKSKFSNMNMKEPEQYGGGRGTRTRCGWVAGEGNKHILITQK